MAAFTLEEETLCRAAGKVGGGGTGHRSLFLN